MSNREKMAGETAKSNARTADAVKLISTGYIARYDKNEHNYALANPDQHLFTYEKVLPDGTHEISPHMGKYLFQTPQNALAAALAMSKHARCHDPDLPQVLKVQIVATVTDIMQMEVRHV